MFSIVHKGRSRIVIFKKFSKAIKVSFFKCFLKYNYIFFSQKFTISFDRSCLTRNCMGKCLTINNKPICQILDSRQECRLVTVLRRHLERIFVYKTWWNYTLGPRDCFKKNVHLIQLNINKVCYFDVEGMMTYPIALTLGASKLHLYSKDDLFHGNLNIMPLLHCLKTS